MDDVGWIQQQAKTSHGGCVLPASSALLPHHICLIDSRPVGELIVCGKRAARVGDDDKT